jgi:3-oxoacyl-[acyl-carrier-protein] synthase II
VRRVVVTGLGAVTPLGLDAQSTWDAAVAGRSGVDWIRSFDASDYPVRIASEVKGFEPESVVGPKDARRLERNVVLAVAAAREAWADAAVGEIDPARAGVLVGSAIGGVIGVLEQDEVRRERGHTRVSPWFLPNVLVDSASGQIAIDLGLRGPNYAPVSACATGSHAVGEGAETIRRGDADVVLAGGTESCMHPVILAGFCAMRGLVAEEEDPALASRPFDATRAGFVMGEGACVLLLEDLDRAVARGARIYAEVLGYGTSNDAHHMAQPDPESVGVAEMMRSALARSGVEPEQVGYINAHGTSNDAHHMAQPDPESVGVAEMMRSALARSGVEPEQVGYINAHGTSTPQGDLAETKAVKAVFGEHAYELAISSTKSVLGHLFGAAGAVEAMMCVRALHEGVLPPTINYRNPDPECDLDYVPNEAREVQVGVALSNAMGLGGHNACVLLGRVP